MTVSTVLGLQLRFMLEEPEKILAVALIALFAWFRFANPPGVRADTTWSKFLLGRVAYMTINLGVFGALVLSPTAIGTVLEKTDFIARWLAALAGYLGSSSAWLLSALAMTVFLSEIPVLTRLDRAVRDYFHRVAAIPRERRCWTGLLERSTLRDDEAVRTRLATRFERSESELGPEHLSFADDDSPEALWTRSTLLIDRLETLAGQRRFADCLRGPEFKDLLELYGRYERKAAACIDLARSHPDDRAVKLLREEFADQAKDLLAGLHHLAGGLVLRCGRTEDQRRDCVEALGLVPPPRGETRLDIHAALWVVLLLLGFLVPALSHLQAPMVLLIALNCAGGALAAILVKLGRDFYFPRRPDPTLPPIGYYLVAGGAGMGLALVNSVVIHSLFPDLRTTSVVEQLLTSSWKWALIPMAVAAGIAALSDGWLDRRWPALHERFDLGGVFNPVDGLALALGVGAAAFFVVSTLVGRDDVEPLVVAGRMAGTGFILGSLVPALYRNAVRRGPAADPEPVGASRRPPVILRLGG